MHTTRPAQERSRTHAIVEAHEVQMQKTPASRSCMQPEFPVFPQRHIFVVAAHVYPKRPSIQRTRFDITRTHHLPQIEIRHTYTASQFAEQLDISVYDPERSILLKLRTRSFDESTKKAIVRIEWKNETPNCARHTDVARSGKSTIRLINHCEAKILQCLKNLLIFRI